MTRSVLAVVIAGAMTASCAGNSMDLPLALRTTTTAVDTTVPNRIAYLTEVLDAVEAHAYFANRIDVAKWRTLLRERLDRPPSFFESLDLVNRLLSELDDHHSSRLSPTEYAQLNAKVTNDQLTTDPPSGQVLTDGVGYLNLPGVAAVNGSGAYDTYVARAHQTLSSPACGWIIDLRANRGGSVPPMLAAVAPLLGPGTFVGYIDRNGTIQGFQTTDTAVSIVHDTALGASTLTASPTPLATAPVAVLIGGATTSAGEAVAVAFIGRDATRSLGTPTYGVPTGNSDIALSDGSALLLTEAVSVDRRGDTYDGPIQPDEPVDSATTSDPTIDPTVAAASTWLSRQPPCDAPQ